MGPLIKMITLITDQNISVPDAAGNGALPPMPADYILVERCFAVCPGARRQDRCQDSPSWKSVCAPAVANAHSATCAHSSNLCRTVRGV